MNTKKISKGNYRRFDPSIVDNSNTDENIYIFRDLRKAYNVSEEGFCEACGITMEKLQECEKLYFSEKEPAARLLFDTVAMVYRQVLNLGIVPLFPYESGSFSTFLKNWLDEIDSHNFKKAHEMRDQIACFFEGEYEGLCSQPHIWRGLPLDEWLMTYVIYSARLFLQEGRDAEAGEFFEAAANSFEYTDSGSVIPKNLKFCYHRGYAMYHRKMEDYEKSIMHYERLEISDIKLSVAQLQTAAYGHAVVLNHLGCYMQAREKLASFVTRKPKVDTPAFAVNWLMGLLSAHLGNYKISETLIKEGLNQAIEEESEFYIRSLSHNLGYLYYLKGNYRYAIKFFDNALERYALEGPYYAIAVHYKALCLWEMNEIDEFKSLVAKSKERLKNNKVFRLLFECAECLLDIKNPKNFDFIYNNALNVLLGENHLTLLLYYCDLLLKNIPDDAMSDIEVGILRTKCDAMEKIYKGGECS